MRVLLIGAGAIGQIMGSYLSADGSEVTVLGRSGRPAPTGGYELHQLQRGRRPAASVWLPHGYIQEVQSLPDADWDIVVLSVPSLALREGWLSDLAEHAGHASIVSIGQDPRDRALLAQTWAREQIVQATPGMLAYHAPLTKDDPVRGGIAYWCPPRAGLKLAGDPQRVQPLAAALTAAGLHATAAPIGTGELMASMTMPYVAMLSTLDWSVRELRRQLELPNQAAREAAHVIAAMHAIRRPGRIASSPQTARLTLKALPSLAPFDLPTYLRVHFGKLTDQTKQMIDGWIDEGRSRSLPTGALAALRAHVAGAPSRH